MPPLFDNHQRVLRRNRAARRGPELFLLERAFGDAIERIESIGRHFDRALLVGVFDPHWPEEVSRFATNLEVRDPSGLLAERAGGRILVEEELSEPSAAYDLIIAIGTLDTVSELPLAFRLFHHGMKPDGLLIGALSGGHTLPILRGALREADAVTGAAAPHVHPRIEASALSPLLQDAGFANPVVDVDRAQVSYSSLDRLISDLRGMGATNVLTERPRFISKAARAAAYQAFEQAGDGSRTVETFEILHFAAWKPKELKSR